MASTIRLTDELQGRLDAARGQTSRERFARGLLAQALDALDAQPPGGVVLGPISDKARYDGVTGRVPSSAAARAGVAPVPKGARG